MGSGGIQTSKPATIIPAIEQERKMTYAELEAKILELAASPEGLNKLQARRKAMIGLSRAVEIMLGHKRVAPRNRPSIAGVTFTVNQGGIKAVPTQKALTLNIEIGPKNVGKLSWFSGKAAIFVPNGSDETWQWSNNPKDAKRIRQYLQNEVQRQDGDKAQERHIQWQMFGALDARSKSNHPGLQGLLRLRPVALAGYPSEIPTWLNANQGLSTGNIDALTRGTNGPTGAKFLILELKAPDGDSAEKAIQQALTYALALSIEANGDPDRQGCYRTLFESKGSKPLGFGAVAVLHNTPKNQNAARVAFANMAPGFSREGQAPLVATLGVLFYDWDPVAKQADNWQWLEDADPRS
jgi:hypothetical protein